MGQTRRRRLVVVGVAAVLMIGVVNAAGTAAGPRPAPKIPIVTDLLNQLLKPKKAPPAQPSGPAGFQVADANKSSVPLFQSPNVPWPGGRALAHPTREGLALVFLVRENRGDWLRVQIPVRPNGTTAWVRRSDVSLRNVPNHLLVERGARRLTVFHGAQSLGQFPVAVGAPDGPTPTGDFFVDGVVRLARTTGAYGVGQLSVAAFSDVYQTFGGGNGAIAIHGTNRPELIGGTVSHGCIRMLNPDWLKVANLAPTGTPVRIVA